MHGLGQILGGKTIQDLNCCWILFLFLRNRIVNNNLNTQNRIFQKCRRISRFWSFSSSKLNIITTNLDSLHVKIAVEGSPVSVFFTSILVVFIHSLFLHLNILVASNHHH